ncbi:MAG: methanogenesis marker 7 protein [Methanogenium sp.]|nr:methanogenesis marker 7 protein [Methanogenium sp.]
MTLVPITYKGGVYRHDIIVDLIDDLGGYIVQKHVLAQEVVLQSLVPKEDIELIRKIGRPLAGEVIEAPLVGTEIAVVSPSLEIHHLPHSSCDIAEYLRQAGAKTNMIGLSRGFGKRIANLNIEERDIINEHDCAVYLLGNFESCIKYKFPALRRGITVPIILTGRPETEILKTLTDTQVEGYTGGIGRIAHRMKKQEGEIDHLDTLIEVVAKVLDNKRDEIAKDPLSVSPPRLMRVIDEKMQITAGSTHPTPITVQISGLRVKIPYEEFADNIRAIEIDYGITVGDVAEVLPSEMRNYIWIRIRPFSETNLMV